MPTRETAGFSGRFAGWHRARAGMSRLNSFGDQAATFLQAIPCITAMARHNRRAPISGLI